MYWLTVGMTVGVTKAGFDVPDKELSAEGRICV